MGMELLPIGSALLNDTQVRAAAVHVADHVARDYPHDLDGLMPKLAGRSIAYDRRARTDLDLTELLDALGLIAPGGTA